MRVRAARWAAGSVAAASVALIAGGLVLAYVDRHLVPADLSGWHFADVFGQVSNLAPVVVGLVLASRRPGNRIGWLLLVAGLGLGLRTFAHQYGLHALVAVPGSWPGGRAAAWLANWIWVIPVAMLGFVLLLFPTGQLRSPRWRSAAWLAGGAFALATVGALVSATRFWARPFPASLGQMGGPALAFAPAICVTAGTGAERVVVWLHVGAELRPEAFSDPSPNAAPLPVDGQQMPRLPDSDLSVPVVNQGELLGAISIKMPKDEPLRPAGQQLVADVASQAGLVLSNAGLIEDLRASRQRLVSAQDEARRRLERNLHDGAQQDLVALAIKARLGATVEDLAQAREIFGELQTDAAGTLANLRDLARGIYPPLLADLGLSAALNAQAGKSPLPVTVEADGIGRFAQDTEAAVYFCCLEALQNTTKYAHATQVRICLQAANGALCFTVSDDGTGYDAPHTPMGSGQRNMADRLAALGGRLEVRSAPGQGTTITGHLPVRSGTAAETGAKVSADHQA